MGRVDQLRVGEADDRSLRAPHDGTSEVEGGGWDVSSRHDEPPLQVGARAQRGGPVGLETLGAALSEDAETIEDVYEPYLLREGYIQRTPRGRVATDRAYRHLGAAPPGGTPLWERG